MTLAVTVPLLSIVMLPSALMPSESPVALTLPEPLMVTSPPASMASRSVLVALTVPAPSISMSPSDQMASLEDVTLSVLDASPWMLSSAFSFAPSLTLMPRPSSLVTVLLPS